VSVPALVIAADLATDAGLPELLARLRLRGAAWSVLEAAVTPRGLLAALRAADADPARSWLATRDPGAVQPAATAGLYGVVVVGSGEDADTAVVVRHSPDLAGVTIAMVPRSGGCWHA
jgi:hypothetical protein